MLTQCHPSNFNKVKKLFMAVAILAIVSHGLSPAAAFTPTVPPKEGELEPPLNKGDKIILRSGEVLLIKDVDPWRSQANEDVLNTQGITYDLIDSSAIPTIDLTPYKMVIVASDQPQSFYNIYHVHLSKFTDYVSAGGVLQFNGCDMGWEDGFWNQLPGGVTHESYNSFGNTVVKPDHPIVADVPNPFYGFASLDHFLNLEGVQAEIITEDEVLFPTTIEYCLGGGRVIASGTTLEYGYKYGKTAGQILINTIKYAYETGGCSSSNQCLGLSCTLEGSDMDDFLIGTEGDDVICSGNGNDVIMAMGGDDVICGGPGHDVLFGDQGYNLIKGEEGDDLLIGGRNVDLLEGGAGNDVLLGDRGNDFLFGAAGDDYLAGNGGSDLLNAGVNEDVCESEKANSLLISCEEVLPATASMSFFDLNPMLLAPELAESVEKIKAMDILSSP